MSGIVGVVNIGRAHGTRVPLRDVHAMMDVQRHRGPDDSGACGFCFESRRSYSAADPLHLDPDLPIDGILGFNRLSIRDLSAAGHQPMTALDGKVILVFNGKIYNDVELRKCLENEGHSFASTTGTEIVLNLFLEFGFNEMLRRMNGMFAFVIVDLRVGKVFMARDRFGISPLYFTFYKGRVAFASEMKSIIQLNDFDRELDMKAFNSRLVFSRPSNKVLLSGVEMLDPGQAVTISRRGDTRFWHYYDINAYERTEDKYKSIDEALEDAEAVLSDAVRRQMVSDVKVGCQLSGGIDSSLVTYYADRLHGRNLNDTVSIVNDAGILGEEHYIDHVSNAIDLNVHKFKVEQDYFFTNYERMIWHNDSPAYKPFFVCFLRLSEKATNYVTVLLSGVGADELTGGYRRFSAGVYQPFIGKMGLHASGLKSYESYAEYAVMSDTNLTGLLSTDRESPDDLIREQIDVFNGFSGSDFTKQVKFEMTQRLPESLIWQDKMSLANSIENRVPFLDNEFVDFAMRLPEHMLARFIAPSPLSLSDNPFEWVAGKYLLKELCAKKFGRDFAYRKKASMFLDERNMVSSRGFKDYFYDSIFPAMKNRGLVDAEHVRSWYDAVNDITDGSFCSMWRAIGLETWCQLFLDGRSRMALGTHLS